MTFVSWRTTGSRRPLGHGGWGGRSGWTDSRSPSLLTSSRPAGGTRRRTPGGGPTGAEGCAMFLQGVDSVYDLTWVKGVTYGDVHHKGEVEWSVHNFDEADVSLQLQLFDQYEKESLRL